MMFCACRSDMLEVQQRSAAILVSRCVAGERPGPAAERRAAAHERVTLRFLRSASSFVWRRGRTEGGLLPPSFPAPLLSRLRLFLPPSCPPPPLLPARLCAPAPACRGSPRRGAPRRAKRGLALAGGPRQV
ncbi:unnamed protein product [Prorocentrum cordatum]|uniref:Uncharacterized protein n=1 Tax=Prorocentrum cordatum TaxID=2364126 RepID=A0ABN9PJL3_9DINO|nr:unnamed protein product [Polarella glacialis]